MKTLIILLFTLLLIAIFIISCDSGTGPDSISSIKNTTSTESIMSDCAKCHTSSKSPSLDPLITNGDGLYGKHDIHVKTIGIGCEKCHYEYSNSKTHMDGVLETSNSSINIVYFDDTNPSGKWINDTGDKTGSCASVTCHAGTTLTWYTNETWALPSDCSTCHTKSIGNTRQILGQGGDFNKESHHVIDYGNRTNEIVKSNDCKVCHNMDKHMSGEIRLNDKDNINQIIVYDPTNPSTLEPFCLSCHDADGATTEGANALSPFSDTNTLGTIPNEAGNKIAEYWNSSSNIHKSNDLTCAGTGEPGTGCHGDNGSINMHGSQTHGLLTKNLTLPIPAGTTFDYNNFKLCFDCHENYPDVTKEVVLGYKKGGNYDLSWAPTPYYTDGIKSLFRDRYIGNSSDYPDYWGGVSPSYNDNPIWYDPYTPLHNYHLLGQESLMQDVWSYRGDSNMTSKASCTTCHNVHGTDGTVGSTYEEFGITPGIGLGPDRYRTLENYNALRSYPISCNKDCHSIVGVKSSYWFTPADE